MSQQSKVLTITSVGVFMASLDLFIVNLAFPDMAADFSGASLASLSWVLNAYAIVFAALLIPAGRIADRVGRKRIFISGLLLFTGASILCAAAPSVNFLVVARILQATGGALMIPATLGLILAAFPPAQWPAAIGVWSAAASLAAAFGPPIGGLLIEASWRWIFFINVPIGLVAAFFAVRVLSEVREPDAPRPDLLGAAELALGIGLLALGIVKGPEWGWGDPRVLGSFAATVLLLAIFLRRCSRHPAPVIELQMLRIRSFSTANLATAVFFAGFGAQLLCGVLLLTEVWGYSTLKAGLGLAPGPITAALFAVRTGKLGPKVGQQKLAIAGGLTFAASFVYLLATVDSTPSYLTTFMPGFILGGAGVGMVLGTLPAIGAASLPPTRFATGTAVYSMARQLGAAIGVAILVALIDGSGDLLTGVRHGWWLCLISGLGTAAVVLGVGPLGAGAKAESDVKPAQAPA
jgi:EmrB/QacA subfamily drug resistance transporter